MSFKIVFAVALFVLVQDNGCQAGKAFGGPGGFGGFGGNFMLINQIRFQVKAAENEANLTVTTTNTTIQNNIAATQVAIEQEVQAAENRVSASGASKHCLNQHQASLAQINLQGTQTCDQAAQLQAASALVAQFKTIHSQIGPVYATCGGWFTADPATCIETFSLGITTQCTDLKEKVAVAATQAEDDAAICTGNAAQQAHSVVSQADQAFDACVKTSAA